ncbi:hypothetical protein F5Y16DRAFT_318954 [Xylariaceae sp. FL0255]|nr:hypothetical protein F5Y16DRAFT_318954 [Xylariaceae sp. FL0255]
MRNDCIPGQCHLLVHEAVGFTSHCNDLLELLSQDIPQEKHTHLKHDVSFLCDFWWNSIYRVEEDDQLSKLYPSLQLARAATGLLGVIEQESAPELLDQITQSRIAICLYQACFRTLLAQSDDGSWNQSIIETAHGVLVLCEARKFDLFAETEPHISSAIVRAVNHIRSAILEPSELDEEAQNGSSTTSPITESTKLAIIEASKSAHPLVGSSLRRDTGSIPLLMKLWKKTPLFSETPEWEVRTSMLEGTLFRPIIKARRLNIFTRQGVEEDKYFDIIPLAWPTCNNRTRTFAPPCFLFEGMTAALLNYQVDEFMEAVAGVNYTGRISELRQLIDDVIISTSEENVPDTVFQALWDKSAATMIDEIVNDPSRLETPINGHHDVSDEKNRQEVLVPLKKFVTHALKHPAVLSASAWDRKNMTCELRIYLQTHVTQSEDNALLESGKFGTGVMREHFFRWVRTTSADHTSATYTFNFVSCLLSSWIEGGKDCFPSTQEKYYAAAACQHLAAMCRMYNDHGSAVRDHDEANVNSVDFPEFGGRALDSGSSAFTQKKEALFEVAQYERHCLEEAFRWLERPRAEGRLADAQARKSRQMEVWRLFYNVTDLFGQIYVLRDIGSRLTV